ncbi:IclR family transcriptional regulator [Sphingomonas sp. NCPPB 2930]
MPRKPQSASLADADSAPGGAAAVDRALTLLGAFRPGDTALTLAELAVRTRLYKSTALRLLASLEHARLLQRQADGRYALGPEVARLHGLYAASFSLDTVVLPVLQAVVAQTGESAAFHVRQALGGGRWARLCLYRVDSPHAVRDHVRAGDLLPADRGAGARVLIAHSPDPVPGTTRKDQELYARIRREGHCALQGDRSPDLAGISAPVFAPDGRLAGALTLTMPTHRYDAAAIAPVVAAAKALGLRLP